MSLNRFIRVGDNEDITKERRSGTFDTDQMTYALFGDKKMVEQKRAISRKIAETPELQEKQPHFFQNRQERILEASRKIEAVVAKAPSIIDTTTGYQFYHLVNEVIGIEGHQLALHFIMFMPALQGQADDEQQAEWMPRALTMGIIGTYAQTEMGHGTNLSELETTATYDKKTQEFVLNSPTTTSMKWWPGNLGKSSNYAVVVAQLYIDGKCYGPHNFLVQLRDEQTHVPLPGIIVGDIGPKMAYNTTDNGFLKLEHVRIPRRRMLMRHAQVAPDGTYTRPNHPKLGYATMVHVRSVMCWQQAMFLGMATTIAIRYSAVRRQGRIDPKSKKEVQILDYQTQQYRLFPQIARAYAFGIAGRTLRDLYERVVVEMRKGNADLLPELHALSSGMKSVITHQAGQGIEQCRMSCGGHGYSAASRIPEIYGVQIGGCTYEGENMVMLLQTARYLMKGAESVKKGREPGQLVSYLKNTHSAKKSLIGRTAEDEIPHLLSAMEHAARASILSAHDRLESLGRGGLKKEEAWNQNTVEMNRASRLHTRYFMCRCFVEEIPKIADLGTRSALTDLLNLYLHYELLEIAHYLLEDHYLESSQVEYIKNCVYKDLAKVRPNAVSLVDSFDITDREMRSVLGRRDGNVYPALYEWAKGSELNKTDVLPMFEKHLKPMMDRGREVMSKL